MMRPYIIINAAMSVDGKLALGTRKQTDLSDNTDFERVHKLRNSVDAILVGINTVLSDDPRLTVKSQYVSNPKNPIRIVLDSSLRIPANAKVLDQSARTIIVTTESAMRENMSFEVLRCGIDQIDLETMLEKLYEMGIRRLMVEGGGTVIYSFLRKKLFDELTLFIAPVIIGANAPTLANGPAAMTINEMFHLNLKEVRALGNGIYCRFTPL
ncbi:MAG: 2,5-diamino-6-(ribosylamino)-4(3H)-pyrimidinone 5'-phosphate reductase [Thermoplasmata archaeon]